MIRINRSNFKLICIAIIFFGLGLVYGNHGSFRSITQEANASADLAGSSGECHVVMVACHDIDWIWGQL